MFKDFIGIRSNLMSPTLYISDKHHILAYNDVCDQLECRQNAEKSHQHTLFCHQHLKMVTMIKSPTSLSQFNFGFAFRVQKVLTLCRVN